MTILRKEDKEFLNKVKNQPKAPPVKQEGLSERIDNKLMEMAQKSPVIGKFFASAVGSAKGLVEHPINTLRGLAGGIVSAPEKLLRTLKTEVDLALTGNKSRYDKETGKPIIYIENGIPVIKKQKTLAGLISGDENMGQAVRYDDPNFTRKILSAGAETGLNFLIPGLKGLSTAKKIALGTGLGAGYGVTSEAQNDNPDYVAGAGAGTGMGLLFSGVGALASKKGRGGKVVEEPVKLNDKIEPSVVKDLRKSKENLYNEPYVADKNLPVIDFGKKVIVKDTLPSIDIDTGKVTKAKIVKDTTLPSIDIDTGKVTKAKIVRNIINDKREVVDSGVIPDEYSESGVETKLSRELREKYPEQDFEKTLYNPETIKETIEKAVKIKENYPQQFEDIALGKKTTGHRGLDIRIQKLAIEEAEKNNNFEKIKDLKNNKVLNETARDLGLSQNIENGNEWGLSNMIDKVKQNYQENIKGIKADNIERIKQSGKKVLQDAKKMKIEELNNFLNDIIC